MPNSTPCLHVYIEGEFDNAIDSLEASLTTYQHIMGKDHVFTSVILEKLGTCYIRKRRPTEAWDMLQNGYNMRKTNGYDSDLCTASLSFNMGIIYW